MKRLGTLIVALGVALALAGPALADTNLKEGHLGLKCEDGILLLHFVHNQIDGPTPGTIYVNYDGDTGQATAMAYASTHENNGTTHYTVALDGSYTTLTEVWDDIDGGKLVLSDYECDESKKDDGGGGKK